MICDNCIHNAVCERAHFDNHCGYKHTEADVIKPELEKIKAEIENKQNEVIGINQKANFQNENDYGLYFGYESSIGIIDNHIAELKGEKNE